MERSSVDDLERIHYLLNYNTITSQRLLFTRRQTLINTCCHGGCLYTLWSFYIDINTLLYTCSHSLVDNDNQSKLTLAASSIQRCQLSLLGRDTQAFQLQYTHHATLGISTHYFTLCMTTLYFLCGLAVVTSESLQGRAHSCTSQGAGGFTSMGFTLSLCKTTYWPCKACMQNCPLEIFQPLPL